MAQTPIVRGGWRGDNLLVVESALIFHSLTTIVVAGRTEAAAMAFHLLIAIPLPQSAHLLLGG